MNKPVELVLTCADRAEAEKISEVLLSERLITCAKFMPVESKYRWHGKIETDEEIIVLMESVSGNFDRVESEVARLHSYDTFVLKQIPITRLSRKAQKWLDSETQAKD